MTPSKIHDPGRPLTSRLRGLGAALAAALALATSPAGLHAQATTAVATPAPPPYDLSLAVHRPVLAAHGMVVSEQHLATRVGVDILQRGGNAVDAAVAVGFALAVVLPNAGNLGGGGFMVIHDAKTGRQVALDFREVAPAGASRDMYLDAEGKVVPNRSLVTPLAVGVPGSVAGLLHALDRWGTLPRRTVMAPAIRLARNGFAVSEELAAGLKANEKTMGAWAATRAVFFRDGRPLQAGERLVQRDLATSLERIAREGGSAFYRGEIARRIAADMAEFGGLVTPDDLAGYRPVEREPVQGTYRGLRVVSMPPPSSGGTHVIQILKLIERYPLAEWGAGSAKVMHVMAEAMKLAYADRSEYLGDPAFTQVPVKGLTSQAYADALSTGIQMEAARPAAQIKPGRPQPYESDQTTHYSVADRHGNVVATTTTLNLSFGNGMVVRGTGILLNNEMDDFAAKPGVPNAFGLIGGDANAVAPGKRPLSSMSPTIVLKDGQPWIATGSPGGSRIITTTLETLVNLIDFGMNPAEAAATPRFHHQWLPDELRVERGFSPDTLQALRDKGHTVAVKAAMGRTQTLMRTPQGWAGASDPRNPDGLAAGH